MGMSQYVQRRVSVLVIQPSALATKEL